MIVLKGPSHTEAAPLLCTPFKRDVRNTEKGSQHVLWRPSKGSVKAVCT